MSHSRIQTILTRRRVLTGTATVALSSLLPGCSSSNSGGGTSGGGSPSGPASQTITFAPLSPVAFGTPTVTLSATASSGLPVTFTLVSGPGSLAGNILTIKGIGTIVVQAAQAGNSSYAAAASVSQSLVVTNPNPQPVPTGTLTPVSVTVGSTAVGTFNTNLAGLSFEKTEIASSTPLFAATNTNLVGLFKRLGPGILRLGGNAADTVIWDPVGKGRVGHRAAPPDVDNLAAFLKATGWKCLYAVNLEGSSSTWAYPTTTTLAAQEVAYVAGSLGIYDPVSNPSGTLIGIEIGNEPDLYGNSGNGYAGTGWSLSKYETLWNTYRTAIIATTPNAPITGPVDADTYNTWTVPFSQTLTSGEITMLTQHYAHGHPGGSNASIAGFLTADTSLPAEMSALKAAAQSINTTFGFTEVASYSDGALPGISNAYAAAFWAVDFLFACVQGGVAQVNFHGGSTTNYTSPITDLNGVLQNVWPEYYGILFFRLADIGTLYQTTASVGSLNVSAYAVKTASGGLNVVVLNKDTANLSTTIQLPQSYTTATCQVLTQLSSGATAPDLTAASGITIQGSGVALDGTFTPASPYNLAPNNAQVTCYVPALSAVLIKLV